jgi:uncharacterized YccA/Bax inhibitor family protein
VISLVIIAIASLNLILDFDIIQKGVASGQPKYMEWYAAFGLMITLVWLYLEIYPSDHNFNAAIAKQCHYSFNLF